MSGEDAPGDGTGPLLGVVERAIAAVLALDPEAPRILAPLQGRSVLVRLEGLARAPVRATFDDGRIRLGAEPPAGAAAADVVVAGTPAALLGVVTRAACIDARAALRRRNSSWHGGNADERPCASAPVARLGYAAAP